MINKYKYFIWRIIGISFVFGISGFSQNITKEIRKCLPKKKKTKNKLDSIEQKQNYMSRNEFL